LKIHFMRVNERHHSIAVANIRGLRIDPIRTSVQHLNNHVATLEDMIASFERSTCSSRRPARTHTLGEHHGQMTFGRR